MFDQLFSQWAVDKPQLTFPSSFELQEYFCQWYIKIQKIFTAIEKFCLDHDIIIQRLILCVNYPLSHYHIYQQIMSPVRPEPGPRCGTGSESGQSRGREEEMTEPEPESEDVDTVMLVPEPRPLTLPRAPGSGKDLVPGDRL